VPPKKKKKEKKKTYYLDFKMNKMKKMRTVFRDTGGWR
jgi:hypothetical protein